MYSTLVKTERKRQNVMKGCRALVTGGPWGWVQDVVVEVCLQGIVDRIVFVLRLLCGSLAAGVVGRVDVSLTVWNILTSLPVLLPAKEHWDAYDLLTIELTF